MWWSTVAAVSQSIAVAPSGVDNQLITSDGEVFTTSDGETFVVAE